jgi:hypothetical protein
LHARPGRRRSSGSAWNVNSKERVSMSVFGELWAFMRERKKLWLLPIVVVLVVVGGLLVFAQGSALAPFIYSIF